MPPLFVPLEAVPLEAFDISVVPGGDCLSPEPTFAAALALFASLVFVCSEAPAIETKDALEASGADGLPLPSLKLLAPLGVGKSAPESGLNAVG